MYVLIPGTFPVASMCVQSCRPDRRQSTGPALSTEEPANEEGAQT